MCFLFVLCMCECLCFIYIYVYVCVFAYVCISVCHIHISLRKHRIQKHIITDHALSINVNGNFLILKCLCPGTHLCVGDCVNVHDSV